MPDLSPPMPHLPKLLLIDGNSLLYRGFFATRALTTSAGQPTNALFALTNMVLTLLEKEKPSVVYCAWDHPAPTFRHEAFKEYKGTRQETPTDLVAQSALARELVTIFGIPAIETAGYEADDILGTLARQGKAAGYNVLIVTGDSDALQLVEENVQVMMPLKGVTDTKIYDVDAVKERYGLTPVQLTDYRALKGDSSDNIPGVPGIGEKTTTTLLQKYGTIEEILHKLDEVTPSKVQAAIVGNTEQMVQSKMLATILCDVPLPEVALGHGSEAPEFHVPDWGRVKAFFERMEFRSLLRRLPKEGATTATSLDDPNYNPFSESATGAVPKPPLEQVALEIHEVLTESEIQAMVAVLAKSENIGVSLHVGEGGILESPLYGIALSPSEGVVYYVCVATPSLSEPPKSDELGGLFDDAPVVTDPPKAAALSSPSSLSTLSSLCFGEHTKLTVHDAKAITAILTRSEIAPPCIAFDTELAAYLLMAGRRASFPLQEVAEDFAGRLVPPSVSSLDKKTRDSLSLEETYLREKERAIRGAEAVMAVRAVQEPRLAAENLLPILTQMELPVAEILAQMEHNGILVDAPTMQKISLEVAAQAAEREQEIYKLAGVTFQIGSTKQLQEVLYERLKLPATKKTKTGYSTDADTLEELSEKFPIVSQILHWRELTKLRSTYTDAMPLLIAADGRLHTSLNQTVAATGRLSSSNPSGARFALPLSPLPRGSCSPPTTHRSNCV
jgi:DNA polymerase I